MHGAWTVRSAEITVEGQPGELVLLYEDFSDACPGMGRYTIEFRRGGEVLYTYHTNTHEYPPGSPQSAESVALTTFSLLANALPERPDTFLLHPPEPRVRPAPAEPREGALIILGSPRRHGNTATLAGWAADACAAAGLGTTFVYPDERAIGHCTACYRCFNTGRCVIEDDMDGVIRAIEAARLIVVCTPVAAGTVSAALKDLIDRSLSLAAARALSGQTPVQWGLLCSAGAEDFTCVYRVVHAFFTRLGIRPLGNVLVPDVDEVTDLRADPVREKDLRDQMGALLATMALPDNKP